MAVGPREWSPKEEPAEGRFEFAGIKIRVKRTEKKGWEPNQELYQAIATAPDGVSYRYTDSNSTMARYHGTGLLSAAMAVLLNIEFIKADPAQYRDVLQEHFGLSKHKAARIVLDGKFASQSFEDQSLQEAMTQITTEMNKIPTVQRGLKRSWDAFMKRRGQPPSY